MYGWVETVFLVWTAPPGAVTPALERITRNVEASLRRAVSTAYYALFHLLIDEAVGNWDVEHQRGTLARTLEHGVMARVCEESVKGFISRTSRLRCCP